MILARCPKCNKEAEVDTSVVLTSNPSINNTTIERDTLKRIEELERHIKEQAKVLDDIEDRLSNLEYK